MPKKAKQPTLPTVFQRMYEQTLYNLDTLNRKFGVEYAIHNDEYGLHKVTDGLKKGMPKAKSARGKRATSFPYGAIAKWYMPFIKELEPDGYASIPVGEFPPLSIQAGVSARASQMWGTGSHSCSVSNDKKFVELWRYPEGAPSELLTARGYSTTVLRHKNEALVADDE
jgi:hypothetical protein